jgi:hypothetical protein
MAIQDRRQSEDSHPKKDGRNVMKTTIRLFMPIIFVVFLFSSCATTPAGKTEPVSLMYIEGIVQGISGNELVLELKLPEFKKTQESPVSDIAQQVAQKSILIEGVKTDVDGRSALVKEIRGNIAIITLETPFPYPVGSLLKLKIPKKTIAIVDFEVIKGKEKEAGRVTMESLASALIDSGQFIVVERSKLKTIMNELQLSASGLTREKPEQVIGNLFIADLILTGTFAEIKGEWDINLRIINVRSGQAMAAIPFRTRLLAPTEMRDSGSLNEDFEDLNLNPSWVQGSVKRGGGRGGKGKKAYFEISTDRQEGATGSKHSVRIDFSFDEDMNQMMAAINNRRKRDLSLYSGVEFYIKATEPLNGQFDVLTSLPEDPNRMDRWFGTFKIDTTWKKVRVPFDSLAIARGWIRTGAQKQAAKLGDQILRIDRVEGFRIGIYNDKNQTTSGKIWIDQIIFYTD